MVAVVGSVLDQLGSAYEAAKGKGGVDGDGNLNEESVGALRDDVYAIVVAEYDNCRGIVASNVGGLVHFLDMMMAPEDDA